MSNQALVEITGSSQATVEVVASSPAVVEVSRPATPVAIELVVPGPQGPAGVTGAPGPAGASGVVSASAPLIYDAPTKALSIDSTVYATAAQGVKADTALQPDALRTGLIDATSPNTIYVGRAVRGSAPALSVWTITRTTYSTAGLRLTKGTATAVTWTGRTSHSYT
jgi:hypothetical protein